MESLPFPLVVVAVVEHLHVRLVQLFFPLCATLSAIVTNEPSQQELFFFLAFALVVESGTANATLNDNDRPTLFAHHAIYFSTTIAKLVLGFLLFSSGGLETFSTLTCCGILFETLMTFSGFLFLLVFLNYFSDDGEQLKLCYRARRRTMEKIVVG